MALAGCMSTSAPPPQAAAPPPIAPAPAASQTEAAPPPHPARKPAPPALASLPNPAGAPDQAAEFSRLTGLDQDETVAMLGEPQQRADAPPAILWRYTGNTCELDVYFYLDLQSREMRVLHYELRGDDGSERTQQKCYSELVSARRAE